ncbi:MAG: WYL domain-containing protein [Polaromonas sp.]|nr:WYL domain-containing protein [Polaromonas sp.]
MKKTNQIDETPTTDVTPALRWSQERRLQFIDFRLQWGGKLNRADLTRFFQISVPQASTDIRQYIERAPGNLAYDRSSRVYAATPAFSPLFETSGADQYMTQLLALEQQTLAPMQSFVEMHPALLASVDLPSRRIDEQALKMLLRAISEQGKVNVGYQSIARDEPLLRDISPHAFGHDGMRWHVRAYCHRRNGFRDFVLGRILTVELLGASDIKARDDLEWHTMIELQLTPDPELSESQRRGVELDYGMENGQIALVCRQAMLFYTVRALNLELDGQPRPQQRQLAIANLEEIRRYLPTFGQR